jgi:hypothetical protein
VALVKLGHEPELPAEEGGNMTKMHEFSRGLVVTFGRKRGRQHAGPFPNRGERPEGELLSAVVACELEPFLLVEGQRLISGAMPGMTFSRM